MDTFKQLSWLQILIIVIIAYFLYQRFIVKKEKYSDHGYRDSRYRNARGRLLSGQPEVQDFIV